MKSVLIFGSTGSIGKNALDVVRRHAANFRVKGLCAHRDVIGLRRQLREFKPAYVCVVDPGAAAALGELPAGTRLFKGPEGLEEFARLNCDISVMGISGVACLKPLMINLKHAKCVALASKEPIVVAGTFVFEAARRHKTRIIPVDSEINALFQLFSDITRDIDKVYLTASGGSLFDYTPAQLKKVGVKEVLSHPTWRMGKRITVDSATLVNKGFEVVETHHFFNIAYEDIGVVIHRESQAHALVQCRDNAMFACIYPTDMRIPLAYALNYPQRRSSKGGLDFSRNISFSFQPLDYRQFPLLKLVRDAALRGANSLAVVNACDEVAVESFLAGHLSFTDIRAVLEHVWEKCPYGRLNRLDDVYHWDEWARAKTREYIKQRL
jgi:1-deoxy-D-xylulose-5-phosphate reductoisomerase